MSAQLVPTYKGYSKMELWSTKHKKYKNAKFLRYFFKEKTTLSYGYFKGTLHEIWSVIYVI